MACVALCLILFSLHASAAHILYIGQSGGHNDTRGQVSVAAAFYGLQVDDVKWQHGRTASLAARYLNEPSLVAVVIEAEVLPALSSYQSIALLRRRPGLPLLIAGINDGTAPALLKYWSSGSISACLRSPLAHAPGHYKIAVGNVTQQLSGALLPLERQQVFYLDLSGNAQTIIQASFADSGLPVLARAASHNVFFATEQPNIDIPVTPDPYRQQKVFAALASPLIFLHYAAGERAWHSPGAYANFTFDDAWLREPYGYVSFPALLEQAQQHGFHVTIAFIPWNFDRSQPDVAALFRKHPDRLSICIHGNNHVHQEFGPFSTHPFEKQIRDIDQALARMEKFKQLTKVSYDPVMIFPHSVSPAATFSVLQRDNYLATVNSLNVPSDASTPPGLDFALRTATLQFSSFPSLRRYSAETDISPSQLAIDAFLGNPMLFYAHESFFASGIGAFNRTADFVNQLQPSTQWRSLGDIVQHLYLERLRDDGNIDIRALSGSIRLRNDQTRNATFFIEKREDSSGPLTVTVDGKPFPFLKTGTQLTLQLPIAAGAARLVEIRYQNSNNIAAIDISRSSLETNAIRLLSDFRDNVVSNTGSGRWFIRSYSEHGSDWNVAFALLLFIAILLLGAYIYLVRRKSHAGSTLPCRCHDASGHQFALQLPPKRLHR
ncbi:hypothetical protein [Edaphobacter sp. DSM 109919]|uniref:NodB homology domain-containing protein n=1 Tax=Edaphobacter paludis TaxID=3035702 RepID=A0AAU7CUS6_9BACT